MDVFNTSESNINIHNKTEPFLNFYHAGFYFNLIVVLPENSYVIWLIVTGAGNGVASEFFSLNLSICEIFLCLQSLLSLLSNTFPSLSLVVMFLTGIPITGRPLFQCLICVERYLAVIYPVTFLKFKPLRYRVICSIAVWLMVVFNCVLFTIYTFNMYVFMCYCLCQALLPLSVKLFCCVAVLRALKQSGPGETRRQEENLMKRRAFNTIAMITMAILLIYAAFLVAALIYVLTLQFIPVLWSIGQFSFLLGGLVQPLLYLHRIGKLPFCKAV